MAAIVANPLPAMSAPAIPQPKKRPSRPAPFNPGLLSHKLEAHRQELDHQQRDRSTRLSRRRSHDALKTNGTYIPRTAAQQFALTATPGEKDQRPKRATTTKQRPKPPVINEDVCKFNPKQMQAGLSLGLSESEVIAAMSAPVRKPRRGSDSSIPVKRSLRPPTQSRSRSRSRSRRPKDAAGRTNAPHQIRKKPSRSPSDPPQEAQPYRPGDAAKRNENNKRRSFNMPPLTGTIVNVSVEHESFWSPLRDLFIDDLKPRKAGAGGAGGVHQRNKENEMPYDMAVPETERFAPTRPKLVTHDRHDWAQASQYGDDLPKLRPRSGDHLHVKTSSRRAKSPGTVRKAKSRDQLSSSDERQTSPVSEDMEKMEKHEEKARRRQSIAGFFKRK